MQFKFKIKISLLGVSAMAGLMGEIALPWQSRRNIPFIL
jgi:hypothetical protein